ncbi:MAG: TMEM175 family protein, partial [Actinomycetota bacterium]|nr:TMEM175 family protein [Actinomycetota bacterium]
MLRTQRKSTGPRRYLRSENNTEFQRVVSFSDGVFAIAMTLLVVTVEIPVGIPMDRFTARLRGVVPEVLSFFISFAVIGRYWMVHHQFFGLLKAINSRLVAWNLVYLAFIAFLPFPTALIGEYSGSPLSVIAYALCTGCVSALETKMIVI